ncbi:MoxR-like ATPase [Paraoerskovia marina]|uniref:MoxR-like ATPase n=1 Tax=Paraoerskovia marina TaxID=545619 RepID=A0A1H1TRC4_9CELL|nr:MoxR family ATPase [Paraoerskovia marina]SDS62865.1 MoxR-like ATPase [Paraoerskovia marina]
MLHENAPLSTTATLSPGPVDLAGVVDRIHAEVSAVVVGQSDVVTTALAVLLARGHLLVEDVPGVGKTTLAKAIARTVSADVGRVQFTPDLLPSDLTGVSVYRAERHEFEFRPGPVFAHIVIADEINRASPKTQSALLECMAEQQVTVDGTTYPLPRPFFVVATQNPVEMEGTYALPEAQRDRFMARVAVGYPDSATEVSMLDDRDSGDPLERITPVTDAHGIEALRDRVASLYASAAVKQYVVDLVSGTRTRDDLRLGASPRASLQLLAAARAHAAISGRDHVLPDDVQKMTSHVLAHRVVLRTEARLDGRSTDDVILDVLRTTPVPAHRR